MASLNRVILIGNLTRDPELRFTPSGSPVAGFGLREATFASLLTLYGLGADKGALLGAMMSAQAVMTAVVGGVINLLYARNRPTGAAEATESTSEERS